MTATADTGAAAAATNATPDPRAWYGHRLLEIRRAGQHLGDGSINFVLPSQTTLEVLASTVIGAVGLDFDDHGWLLSHPDKPRGQRRNVVSHDDTAPRHWAHYFGPRDWFSEWVRHGSYEPDWLVAAAYTVEDVFGHADEAHLMVGFGDSRGFRLRILDLDADTRATDQARALLADPVDGDPYTPDLVTGPVYLDPGYGPVLAVTLPCLDRHGYPAPQDHRHDIGHSAQVISLHNHHADR